MKDMGHKREVVDLTESATSLQIAFGRALPNLGLEQTRPFSVSTMVVDRTGGGFDSRRANAGGAGLAAQSTIHGDCVAVNRGADYVKHLALALCARTRHLTRLRCRSSMNGPEEAANHNPRRPNAVKKPSMAHVKGKTPFFKKLQPMVAEIREEVEVLISQNAIPKPERGK